MDIEKLSNHISYNKIFTECRDEKGKIDWLKVVTYPDLPEELIDRYFFKLKSLGLEKFQSLSENILKKYKYHINWHSMIINSKLSENYLNEFSDIFERLKIWSLVFKYQNVNINFLINHIDIIKRDNLENVIMSSPNIKEEDKIKIHSLLRSK